MSQCHPWSRVPLESIQQVRLALRAGLDVRCNVVVPDGLYMPNAGSSKVKVYHVGLDGSCQVSCTNANLKFGKSAYDFYYYVKEDLQANVRVIEAKTPDQEESACKYVMLYGDGKTIVRRMFENVDRFLDSIGIEV